MSGINTTRVLLGGLVAGLVINVGEFLLNGPVAGAQYNAALLESGLPTPDAGMIGVYVAMAFVWGISAVWLYAAIRPRYGAGATTAIRAGAVLWVVGYLFPTIGFTMMGIMPSSLALFTAAWGLVEIPGATVAGAWAYREETAPATAAAPAPMG